MSETWTNRTEIKSASSSRIYIVSEKVSNGVPTGTWGCSCPGWKSKGACKHLSTMGLTSCRTPSAISQWQLKKPARHGPNSFSDSAYRHYDIRDGFGSAEEWIRLAEQRASGRSRYQRPRQFKPSQVSDMKLLNLTVMPADVKGLVSAMRKQAYIDHPDREGGDTERFKIMINAYERLLKYY
jgi:hypothetical protein